MKTNYPQGTPPRVISILETARLARKRGDGYRLRIHYGNPSTGKSWGDTETGYIGRSTGPIQIPLIIANSKSSGGRAILIDNIVKIEYASKKKGGVLYDITPHSS